MRTKASTSLVVTAFVLSGLGVLLVCEVIRPFRDLSVDGPLAMVLWGLGVTCGGVSFFSKGRSVTLSVIAVAANLLPLFGALGLMWLMSGSNFTWH